MGLMPVLDESKLRIERRDTVVLAEHLQAPEFNWPGDDPHQLVLRYLREHRIWENDEIPERALGTDQDGSGEAWHSVLMSPRTARWLPDRLIERDGGIETVTCVLQQRV